MPAPSGLSPADCDVISLALERRPHSVVIDDRVASRFATRVGLKVVGTLGVIAAARRRGLVDAARPLLGRLVAIGEEPLGEAE